MKRKAEPDQDYDEYARLVKVHNRLRTEIDAKQSHIIAKEKEYAGRERVRFLRELSRKHGFPLETEGNIDEVDLDNPIATYCLSIPELATIILAYMGPYELFMISRVSQQFTTIVTDTFPLLASYYLTRYGKYNGSNDCVKNTHNGHLVSMNIIAKQPDIGIYKLLSLWAHFFQVYEQRGHMSIYNGYIEDQCIHIDYSFIYNHETLMFTRLRDCIIYQSQHLIATCNSSKGRWHTKYPLFDIPREDRTFSYLDYTELCSLQLTPLSSEFFRLDGLVIVDTQRHTIIPLDSAYDRYTICWLEPPRVNGTVIDRAPFFDLCERRRECTYFLTFAKYRYSLDIHIMKVAALVKKPVPDTEMLFRSPK